MAVQPATNFNTKKNSYNISFNMGSAVISRNHRSSGRERNQAIVVINPYRTRWLLYGVILTSCAILFLRTRAHFKVNNVMTLTVTQFEIEHKNSANLPNAERVTEQRTAPAITKKRRESEKRTAKTIGVVITVFTLSWVPYGYVLVSDPEQHVNSFYIWAVAIAMTNSAVNLVIYFFSSKDFRESSKQVLRSTFRY